MYDRSSQKMEFIKISSKLLTYRLKAFNIISAISSKYSSPAQTFPLNSRITCPVAYLTSSLGYLTKFSNSTSKTKLFTFKSCSLKNLSISVNTNCILLIAQSKTLEIASVPPSLSRAVSSPLTNTLALSWEWIQNPATSHQLHCLQLVQVTTVTSIA